MSNYTTHEPAQCDFVKVAESSEVGENERLKLEIGEHAIIVLRVAGKVYAIANQCSHDGNSLDDGDLDGYEIECSRHGGVFDIRTGEVLALPAVRGIPAYPVRETNGQIEVGIPK